MPPDSKETELGSNQEASPSAGKNTGVVLVPCSRMEVRSYSASFVMTDEFSVIVTKITWRIGVSWTHTFPFYLSLTYLNLMNYDYIIKSL